MRDWRLSRVISGGQSGADRAGLEVARALGIPTGGTAPKGWRTEYGPDLDLRDVFGLVESESLGYDARTLANVRGSDGTVVFGAATGGTGLTLGYCRVLEKPHLHNSDAATLRAWITEFDIKILNVAGSRHSKNPRIFDVAAEVVFYAITVPSARPVEALIPRNPHAGR